jgi:hypothetical protein
MRIGCITGVEIKCDGCGRNLKHPERYLCLDEDADGETRRLCTKCALDQGYAEYRKEKGVEILSFFTEES